MVCRSAGWFPSVKHPQNVTDARHPAGVPPAVGSVQAGSMRTPLHGRGGRKIFPIEQFITPHLYKRSLYVELSMTALHMTSTVTEPAAISPAPLFNWLTERMAGVLVHPTALPSRYGIGAFDEEAIKLLEFFAQAGIGAWQVCPLGPTGYGDSPYQCFSAFAGNPYLISFEALLEDGLVTQADLAEMPDFNASRVDFGQLIPWKLDLLQKAFAQYSSATEDLHNEFNTFRQENSDWLEDYALF